ncbi:MAG: hypothetical protein GX303_02310 [Clostridiales bacterium]|nr:hypothetical protein [Clostridiales bacterium]
MSTAVIIPQIDPETQEIINIINTQIQKEWKLIQKHANMATKTIIDEFNSPKIQELLEMAKSNTEEINKRVMAILNATAIKVKKTIGNLYKKITCSRTPRSHSRASGFSKSTQGDSGDPDQPDPDQPPGLAHLLAYPQISHTQKNKSFFSWQSAPNGCLVFGGGQR